MFSVCSHDSPSWLTLVALALSVFVVTGCPESNKSRCGSDSECGSDEHCVDGICQAKSGDECTIDSDCPSGYYCEEFKCRLQQDYDVGPTDSGEQDGSDDEDTGKQDASVDTGPDNTPPEVVSITPSDGSTDVPLGTKVTVEFNEPMRDISIRPDSVKLLDPNGNAVDAKLDKNDPKKVVLTPKSDLWQISPYRVVVTKDVQDQSMNPIKDGPVEADFSTVFNEVSEHAMLARKWAPWVYQGIRETDGTAENNDIPTTIDFDGDLDASNNEENARKSGGSSNKAHVYYNVSESESHYFIHYLMYYPTRRASMSSKHTEHHYAGAVFVIDKKSDKLVVVDGVKLRPGNPFWAAFTPKNSGVTGIGSSRTLVKVASSEWQLEDGSHYPMYVTAGEHATCHWYTGSTGGLDPKCVHRKEEFIHGKTQGVVMKPGTSAQTYGDAKKSGNSNLKSMTYKLVPFARHFWALRTLTGSSKLFSGSFTYQPNSNVGNNRPGGYPGASENHQLPKALTTGDSNAANQTPFRWESFTSGKGNGQWLLDPAIVTTNRFDLSQAGQKGSEKYCYNLFFDINERNSSSDPNCTSGSTGGDAGMTGDAGMSGADAGN